MTKYKKLTKNICIQGIGYVGAATMAAVANAKDSLGKPLYEVKGIDINTPLGIERINSINNGFFPFETSDKDLDKVMKKAHKEDRISASYNPDEMETADVIIINISLDVSRKKRKPYLDFKNFDNAILDVGNFMNPDALVIIETTTPPGTSDKRIVPILLKCFKNRRISSKILRVAHSYERVMPGPRYLNSIINNWKVYAGYNKKSADLCEKFLKTIINYRKFPLTRLASMTASETAKIMENSYRAVNIAFIEEWARFSEKIGINSFEVIDAIRMRPTHNNIRQPGFGVGGYCLTKDPLFANLSAQQLFDIKSLNFPFSEMGVKINNNMPLENFNLLKKYIHNIKNKKILVLGAAYRSEVDDTRNSPSETFILKCLRMGAKIDVHDPYAKKFDKLDIKIVNKMPKISNYNAVVLAVNHKFYSNFDFVKWMGKSGTVFLDTTNLFKQRIYENLIKNGNKVIIPGRGDL